MTVGHDIEGSVDFIAHLAAAAIAVCDFNITVQHRLRYMRLGQRRQQQLDEFAIPHALLGALARRGRHFQAGEKHGAS